MTFQKKIIVLTILCLFLSGTNAVAYAEISRTLRLGDKGLDVRELQVFLNSDPDTLVATEGVGSKGNESTYFGARTAAAVNKLQIKYAVDILTPAGLSGPTAIVGALTRALITKVSWQAPVNVPQQTQAKIAPQITTVDPFVVTKNPQTITLRGSGFTTEGNSVVVLSDGAEAIGSFSSPDGKTISFPFVSETVKKIEMQLAPYKGISTYQALLDAFIQNSTGETITRIDGVTYSNAILKITNAYGESNIVTVPVNLREVLK